MELHRIQRRKIEVPIVPLIDILTILLIFFIVTTTFKEPKPVLEVEVPVASGEAVTQSVETRSVLSISATGDITLDAVRVLPGELENYLSAFRSVNPGRKIELRVDQRANFGEMVKLWDTLRTAGFDVADVPHRVRVE